MAESSIPGLFKYPGFIDPEQTHFLKNSAIGRDRAGEFRVGQIGKAELKKQRQSVRSDKIVWIDQDGRKDSELVHQIYSTLLEVAKKEFFLPIKRYECHFAKYEPGSFYLPHRDRHKLCPSRLLTAVLYLNDLEPGQGGELIVYGERGEIETIRPQAGLMVLFDSRLLHEVQVSKVRRWSLTGWFRDDIHPGLAL